MLVRSAALAALLGVLLGTAGASRGSKDGLTPGIVHVDPGSQLLVLPDGRVAIMHGLNAVYKVPPFLPTQGQWTWNTSIVEEDIAFLHANGFNSLRLGLLWEALMPTSPAAFNETFLADFFALVR